MKRLAMVVALLVLTAGLALAHGDVEHVLGVVTKVSSDAIEVKTAEGDVVTVAVDANTKFSRGRALAKLADVKEGGRVVIDAAKNGDKLLATVVKLPAVQAPPSAT